MMTNATQATTLCSLGRLAGVSDTLMNDMLVLWWLRNVCAQQDHISCSVVVTVILDCKSLQFTVRNIEIYTYYFYIAKNTLNA